MLNAKRLLRSVGGVFLLLLTLGVGADPTPEQLLDSYDRAMQGRISSRFPVDDRYNDVLNAISLKVLPQVPKVFPQEKLPGVRFGVYLSNLGFNAFTLHRTILIDSLLLDGLTRMCQGAAVYGSMQNVYNEKLAKYIAAAHSSGKLGFTDMKFDQLNPYRIPAPPGLTAELNVKAQKMFEETLGCWICHEIAHVLLGHIREKVETGSKLREELLASPGANVTLVDEEVSRVVNYEMGPARELEADRLGARLAKASGYPAEAFRRSLLFVNRLESYLEPGVEIAVLKAHPAPAQRWKVIQAEYAR